MKEGELLADLIKCFEQRDKVIAEFDGKDRVNWLKAIDRSIIMRHAFAWYDGEEEVETERWQTFYRKAKALIKECHENGWHKQPDILSEKWVDGVLEIDECHQEDQPLKDGLEQLDWEDLTRHWLNGGSRFGIAKNIYGQINKIVKKNNKRAKQEYNEMMSRAEKRYSEG